MHNGARPNVFSNAVKLREQMTENARGLPSGWG